MAISGPAPLPGMLLNRYLYQCEGPLFLQMEQRGRSSVFPWLLLSQTPPLPVLFLGLLKGKFQSVHISKDSVQMTEGSSSSNSGSSGTHSGRRTTNSGSSGSSSSNSGSSSSSGSSTSNNGSSISSSNNGNSSSSSSNSGSSSSNSGRALLSSAQFVLEVPRAIVYAVNELSNFKLLLKLHSFSMARTPAQVCDILSLNLFL